jgi:4-hydroxybenzoate polyprenyltransferase
MGERKTTLDYLRAFIVVHEMKYLPAAAIFCTFVFPFLIHNFFTILPLWMTGLAVILLADAAGGAANDLSDYELDKAQVARGLRKKLSPEMVELLGKSRIKLMMVFETLLMGIITLYLSLKESNPYLIPYVAFVLFLSYGYSLEPFRFKRRGVVSNIVLAVVLGAAPIFFMLLLHSVPFTFNVAILLIAFTLNQISNLYLSDIRDYYNDTQSEIKTPAVAFGLRRAVTIANSFFFASVLLFSLLILGHAIQNLWKLWILALFILPMLYIARIYYRSRKLCKQYDRATPSEMREFSSRFSLIYNEPALFFTQMGAFAITWFLLMIH